MRGLGEATKVPKPLRRLTMPSCSSRASAWRTVVRETPKRLQLGFGGQPIAASPQPPGDLLLSSTPASWNQKGTGEERSMLVSGSPIIL